MFSKKTLVADLLFWVQLVFVFWFFVPQVIKLFESTQGQSLSMQFVMLGFLVLNLGLAFAAYIEKPEKVAIQIIAIYCILTFFVVANIFAIFWNGKYIWSPNDDATLKLVAAGATVIIFICWIRKVGIKDPIVKGLLAVAFKAVPQFMMALKIFDEGGGGVPIETIILGNVNVFFRIGQIIFSIIKEGRERNRFWMLIAEVSNEITWAMVSIAWFGWFLGF